MITGQYCTAVLDNWRSEESISNAMEFLKVIENNISKQN